MKDDSTTLYIPMGVKTETEIFPGFGRKQLFQSAVGSGVAGAIACLIWLMSGSVAFTIVMLLAGIAGSVMMSAKHSRYCLQSSRGNIMFSYSPSYSKGVF